MCCKFKNFRKMIEIIWFAWFWENINYNLTDFVNFLTSGWGWESSEAWSENSSREQGPQLLLLYFYFFKHLKYFTLKSNFTFENRNPKYSNIPSKRPKRNDFSITKPTFWIFKKKIKKKRQYPPPSAFIFGRHGLHRVLGTYSSSKKFLILSNLNIFLIL